MLSHKIAHISLVIKVVLSTDFALKIILGQRSRSKQMIKNSG